MSHDDDKITEQKSATHAKSDDKLNLMFCLAGTVDDDKRWHIFDASYEYWKSEIVSTLTFSGVQMLT